MASADGCQSGRMGRPAKALLPSGVMISKLREVAVWQTVLELTARVAQSPATIRLRVSRARPGSERAPAKTLVSRAYHTIPVPRGWSIEQAWEAIQRGDLLTDEEPSWANILAVGGKFQKVMWPE